MDLTPYVRITKSREWKGGREAASGRCRAFFFEEKKAQCDTSYGQKADSQDHFHGSDFVFLYFLIIDVVEMGPRTVATALQATGLKEGRSFAETWLREAAEGYRTAECPFDCLNFAPKSLL